ncbi:MAG: hypothetical protein V7765_13705 [Oleispira sp.]
MPAFNKTLLTIISVSLLFGCSALEDDDDSAAKVSMSGKVADGYLASAKVCLDLNSNKVCDEGEPSTTSTTGGEFTLDGVTQAQLDSAPLLVEVVVGETIDEDYPSTTIDKKFTLTAPAGYAFISPLTTMVQSEIEDGGLSPEEAEGSVQAKLGTTLDLEADYVAGSGGTVNADEFERLHKIAQVTVVVLQNNIELVEEVLAGADVSFEDLVGLIVAQVLDALETISTEVTSAGENFDPDTVADSDAVDAANVDAATIEDDIAEREAARETVAANIASLFDSGESIHIFDADSDNGAFLFGYETITKTADGIVNFLFTQYSPTSDTWVAQTEEGQSDNNEQICILENSAFTCTAEDTESVTIENNAVVIKLGDFDSTRTEITGVSVDLTGKRIQTFLEEDFQRVINPIAAFTTGAVGYKLSFERTQAMHALFKANVTAITECWQDGGDSQAIEAGQPFSPTDVWCNNAFIRTGDGDHSTDGDAATSLDDIISATAVVNPSNAESIKGTTLYGRDFEIMAEFVTGGTANFYIVKHELDLPSSIEGKVVGSWQQQTIEGKTLLTFMLPPVLAELGDLDSDERSQFFTVEDGFVRRGGVQPAGIESKEEWVINDTARDQVLTAFDYDLLVDLVACSTGNVDFDPDNLAEAPGATAAELVTAATNCSDVDFGATELVDTTLVTDFGFLNFKAAGAGVFLGEVGDDANAVLDFTWTVNSDGHVVVNAQATEGAATIHLRLTLAKVAANSRQISLVTFGQEAATAAELNTIKGNIFGEVWGIN